MTTVTQTVEAMASKAMYGGAGVAGGSTAVCFLGWTRDEWTLLFGFTGAAVAVAGFFMTWFYKAAHLKLARAKAQADPEE